MSNERTGNPFVDGATRLFPILGDPIAQVKSPAGISSEFHAKGHNALCIPLHVSIADFDTVMRGLKASQNCGGYILTVPHKLRAMPYVEKPSARAQRIGAVNIVRRDGPDSWVGDMLDGVGFARAARNTGFDFRGKRALVMGAGGAGSAIIDAIAEAGAAAITISDLDNAKATDVATRLGKAHAGCSFTVGAAVADDHDLIVNATPYGMGQGDGMPAPFGKLDPNVVVADVITRPEITPLLAHARACGCRISTGVQMYQAQAAMIADYLIPEQASV
jgi:shikimate dehydrogenase